MKKSGKLLGAELPGFSQFSLEEEPIDYIVAVHIRNLFETYGEDLVKDALKMQFGLAEDGEIEEYVGSHIKKVSRKV